MGPVARTNVDRPAARATRRLRSAPLAGVLTIFAALLAGCGDPSPRHERDAAVYDAIVDWLVDRELPKPTEEVPLPVFFEALGTKAIPLEVQVELIAMLGKTVEVRFIDHRDEAIDRDDPALPVQEGGALIGLGSVPDEDPAVVRVELYRSAAVATGYRFELTGSGATWRVTREPEVLPVEDLAIDGDEGG